MAFVAIFRGLRLSFCILFRPRLWFQGLRSLGLGILGLRVLGFRLRAFRAQVLGSRDQDLSFRVLEFK